MIGTVQESSLHASLKNWYYRPGDLIESKVNGYYIDLVRDTTLIEIQTGNFSAIKKKLKSLLNEYAIHIVYPIPYERWIVRKDSDGKQMTGKLRKSPKRGSIYDVFRELVRIADFLSNPNLTIEVLMVREEQIWVDDGLGSWRRKGWRIADRKLLDVIISCRLSSVIEFQKLLPKSLPEVFSVRDLAVGLNLPYNLAGKMIYCLKSLKVIALSKKKHGRAYLYYQL